MTHADILQVIRISMSPNLVKRAIITAAIVGTVLTAINQYEAFINGNVLTQLSFPKALMSYLVPYLVSSVSAATAAMACPEHTDAAKITGS